MIFVVQRVSSASVVIDDKPFAQIGKGLLILIGIEEADSEDDITWLVRKVVNLRIFNDNQGVMNVSLLDVNGDLLLVSQFTLHASTKKGNRPSYIKAAPPARAIPLYEQTIAEFRKYSVANVECGEFGADMQVSLVNDGPVTILIDSKNRL